MILYNRSFADFTVKNGLPAIYRNVEQYLQDNSDPDSSVINSAAFLSTRPDYHPGIGAEAYMHATSPIRRFTDLVNQYQVCGYLSSGQAVFSEAELDFMITEIEKTLLLQREVIQASGRYWFLCYLAQNFMHTPLSAIVVKIVKHGFIAELESWHRKVLVTTDSYCYQGEELLFIPTRIDPEEGILIGEVIQ
ncbi:MAG: RNB domain-containing ribonuclease, partial [Candidatus Cloacimonadaceae bacterium]|nr:RNB domain-containing ribonuclease [Candidatus Cloacimonadaceae bacterium]